MSNFVTFNLQIKDATANQSSLSYPLILGEFAYDDNTTGPLQTGVYFTDDTLVGGTQIRVMEFTSIDEVEEVFTTTSKLGKHLAKMYSQEIIPAKVFVGMVKSSDTTRASALDAILEEEDNFYFINDVDSDDTTILEVAIWAEANDREYKALIDGTNADVKGSGSSDIVSVLKAANYNSTSCVVTNEKDSDDELVRHDAAITGFVSALKPGMYTEKFLQLTGVTAVDSKTLAVGTRLTATNKTNVKNKNGNYISTSNVGDIYEEGVMASGRFCDTQRYSRYVKQETLSVVSLVFVNTAYGNKVPYTDSGVAQITAAISKVLDREISKGRLITYQTRDYNAESVLVPYEITVTPVSEVSDADRIARQYVGYINVKFRYSSAIHSVDIDGDMNV